MAMENEEPKNNLKGNNISGALGYQIVDRKTGEVVAVTQDSRRAVMMVNRRNEAHGGHRFERRPVY